MNRLLRAFAIVLAMLSVPAGCSEPASVHVATDIGPRDAPIGTWIDYPDGGCAARARSVPAIPGVHVDPDAGAIAWLTNPPSSGNHYPLWARWGAWPGIPRGNWVHNLEHGGVVFLYRCDSPGCAARRDGLVAAMNAIPGDPACRSMDGGFEGARVRVVVTDDPMIITPIAAVAWGTLYEASCVDIPSLVAFYQRFAGHAPEDFCTDGFVP